MATIIALCAMAFAGCNGKAPNEVQKEQGNTEQAESQPAFYRSVTAEEYSNSDPDMQRLISLVDGAANALLAMQQNGANRDFEAQIMFSTTGNGPFANTVIISRTNQAEQDLETKKRGEADTCRVCGATGGYDCYKKIKATLEQEKQEEIDINLKLDGDCVVLTY